ncbi:MAG: gamma-glutamylcyclotransferase [Robiginitomaculum sp.]|nr:gamma-glutamylcyclotransferase [Robiginitomaculum sp.]
MIDNRSTVLFVYGTLAPGEENAHIMDGMEGTWRKASVRGTRYDTGWGTAKKHPGFIPDENGDTINGQIFTSKDLPNHWARLDKFEGKDYKRIPIKATLQNGETIEAQIYRAV